MPDAVHWYWQSLLLGGLQLPKSTVPVSSSLQLPKCTALLSFQPPFLFCHPVTRLGRADRRVGVRGEWSPRRRSSWPRNSLDDAGSHSLNSQINVGLFFKVIWILFKQSLGLASVEFPELSVFICLLVWFCPALFCVVIFNSSSKIVALTCPPVLSDLRVLVFCFLRGHVGENLEEVLHDFRPKFW